MNARLMLMVVMFCWCTSLPAEEIPLVTPDSAIALALEQNYGIRIAATNAKVAHVNNHAGNAGMLPLATLTGNVSAGTAEHPLGTATPQAQQVKNSSAGVNLSVDWTAFDGGKMFVTRKKLAEIEAAGVLSYREEVAATMASVIAAYFAIVQQQQQCSFVEEVLKYDREQLAITQTGFATGLLSRQAVLQATIDMNADIQKSISGSALLVTKKRALNRLLCRDSEVAFRVVDSIVVDSLPPLQALVVKVDSCNLSIGYKKRQLEIMQLTFREQQALLFPKITVGAGYAVKNDIAGAKTTFHAGPQVQAGVVVPLYRGGAVTHDLKAAKLRVDEAGLDLNDTKAAIRSSLYQIADDYACQIRLLAVEEENVVLAKENLDIALQRYRLAQSTYLELRTAQESYEQAKTQLIGIRYALKSASTQMRLLVADF